MAILKCSCGSPYRCVGCDALLRGSGNHAPEPDMRSLPDVQAYLRELKAGSMYRTTFPIGKRNGAVLDLGDGNRLEAFLPYVDEESGDILPYMPMELDGVTIIHDPTRGKAAKPWQIEACRAGRCRCDETATGWKLTRPLIRGLLGVSNAFLAEHGRDLAGVLPCWCLCVSTPVFMREVIFNNEFRFPTREAARAARAAREAARRCKPPRPTGRWPSRPRRR